MPLLPQDPRKQRMVAVAVVSLGLAGVYYQYVAAPQGEVLAATEAHVDSLEAANAKAAAATRGGTANQIKAEAAGYRRELDALRQLVPTGNEVPALLEQVSTAARRAGLDIASVEPSPVVPGPEFDTYRYKISVAGPYHPVAEFLTNVGSLTRIVAPVNLDLAPRAGNGAPAGAVGGRAAAGALLQAKFEIQTYVAKGAAPGGAAAAAADARVAVAPGTPTTVAGGRS
jgi:type IV pilus assembly protein PilO